MTEDGHYEKIKSLLSKVINMTKALMIVAISLCPKTKKDHLQVLPYSPSMRRKKEIQRYLDISNFKLSP